jgi:PDDEXK-like domain of unknown function (DUF3799)
VMNEPRGTILRDEKPFAVVEFLREKSQEYPSTAPGAEELFLFEKLSGLPWKCYGDQVNFIDLKTTRDAYKDFTVKVSGDPQAVKMLSK